VTEQGFQGEGNRLCD